MDLLAIRGDDVDGDEVVDGEAMRPLHAAHPSAEGETGHTSVADDPDRTGQPERLRFLVELLEERSTLDPRGTSLRIHPNAAHPGEIDEHAGIARRETRDAMAAAADRDR